MGKPIKNAPANTECRTLEQIAADKAEFSKRSELLSALICILSFTFFVPKQLYRFTILHDSGLHMLKLGQVQQHFFLGNIVHLCPKCPL